jgi:hypothetical protein
MYLHRICSPAVPYRNAFGADMIPAQDEELWKRHELKPGDECPFCGAPLALWHERSIFTLFRSRHWVRCSSLACDFAVRLIKPQNRA